ncbi:MAG TPA: Flp pilus assembly protein CpaB [Candidatus Binataceae bacterium]|jgi:pilus assembly protein CpaB|nr:Flp pilus assembly protein CpaB [Candidatus Binataceae bacterium]
MATEILVAARDLPVGTKLQPDDVKLARWPRDSVPSGSITDAHTVVDSIVKSEMVQGEPITAARLYTGDTAGVLSLLIPPDMRAMSVAVDEVSDIAGFVLPHARVDVLVAIKQEGGPAGSVAHSKIVLENVEVLAVAQTTDHKDKPQVERVVTLLVRPEEAERLALASHEGSLRLALRNLNDEKIVNTAGSSVSSLLAVYGGAPVPIERPQISPVHITSFRRPLVPVPVPATRIEVMRDGTSRDALSFGADGRAIRPPSSAQGNPPEAEPSQAQAQPALINAPAARAVAMATGNSAHMATAAVPFPTANEAGNPTMGFEGPDAKTIEAH